MRARGEYFADAGGAQSRLRAAHGRSQTRATRADNNDVKGMIGNRIGLAVLYRRRSRHHQAPKVNLRTANTQAAAMPNEKSVLSASNASLRPSPCT